MVSRMVSFFLRLLVLTFIRLALHCHIVYRVFHSTIHLAKKGSFFCSSKLSQSFFPKYFTIYFSFFVSSLCEELLILFGFFFEFGFLLKIDSSPKIRVQVYGRVGVCVSDLRMYVSQSIDV